MACVRELSDSVFFFYRGHDLDFTWISKIGFGGWPRMDEAKLVDSKLPPKKVAAPGCSVSKPA